MPVVVESVRQQMPEALEAQLLRIYADSPDFESPEAAMATLKGALSEGAVLYTGIFNQRYIAAVLASGTGETRQLRYLCVHPATRGRGVAERLMNETRRLESEAGTAWLEADFNLAQEGIPDMLLALGFIPHGNGRHRARL